MTNDHPIRFRTFADEDDAVWGDPGDRRFAYSPGGQAFEPADEPLRTPRPAAEARPGRGGALVAWGTGLALVAGVAIAVTLLPKPGAAPADGQQGLRVHRYVAAQPGRLATSALLPCYVNGVSVGSRTLADCGQRNGVASGGLDVGLSAPPATTPVILRNEQFAARAPSVADAYQPTAPVRPPVGRLAQATPIGRGELAFAQPSRSAPLVDQRVGSVRSAFVAGPTRSSAQLAYAPSYLGAPTSREAPTFRPRQSAENVYAENDENRSGGRPIDPEDSVRAAQTFYEGLADADGGRAASVVVPEKRGQGPLSAGAIDRFYSGLRAPLRLTRLYPVDDHTVVARYSFVDRGGEVCQGTARVTTTQRNGQVYVQGVRALNGC